MSTMTAVFLVLFASSVAFAVWLVLTARRSARDWAADREMLSASRDDAERRAAVAVAQNEQAVIAVERAERGEAEARDERDSALRALAEARTEHAREAARFAEIERGFEDKRAFLAQQLAEAQQRRADADQLLKDAFGRIAGETLDHTSKKFLELAGQLVERSKGESQVELERRQQAIAAMVKPIGETLEKTRARMEEVERARADSFARLDEKLREQMDTAQRLNRSTENLSRALSKPEVRGRYGEMQLRRVAELAGMVAYCDFTEQTSTRDGDGNLLRPDMVVKLPNDRVVAVDAKCNIDAYVRAAETTDETERERLLEKFASDVTEQAKKLGAKNYWSSFEGSVEFVVMFVPGDHFLDAALARRSDLLEIAARHGVIMVTPATMIGLLRAVAVGWKEVSLAANARELLALGVELHDRAATVLQHAAGLGESLQKAVERYNKFVASTETRLMPTLRRFEDAEARSTKTLAEPTPITVSVRDLALPAPQRTGDQFGTEAGG